MHDKFKRRQQAPKANDRARRQIALEAARRLFAAIGPDQGDPRGFLGPATPSEYYAAKRKAAAVLGHRVRPGDLPSDSEVREQVLALARSRGGPDLSRAPEPDPGATGGPIRMADHLDRFAIYRLRLLPLEAVKQGPKLHPEGDALYHSLQVFELARERRPYDEEFLLAALLHDIGKAIDPAETVAASLQALEGTITERTAWLIEHQRDLDPARDRPLDPRARKTLEESESFEDLELLRELDDAGRVPGAPVVTVDQALEYLRGLEEESYLDDDRTGPIPSPD